MAMLQKGDIVLVRKVDGFKFISDVLVWWQNSKVASHVGVITDEKDLRIFDARMFKKSRIIDLETFFDGEHSLYILRYAPELTDEQKEKIVEYLADHCGVEYDNKSILSLVVNRDIEKHDKLNCGEATLLSYHNANLLTKRNIEYILPHTFWEFYMADRFTLVKHFHKPTKEDIKELTDGT